MAEETARTGSIYGGTAEPCAIILFGASGDLAKRKVIPAMYDLAQHNSLGERYAIIGFARTPMTDDSFRANIGEAAKTISEVGPIEPTKWDAFASNLYYSPGDYADQNSYAQLAKRLAEIDAEKKLGGNRLFYLSTPPEVYPDIVEQLGRSRFTASIITWARTRFRTSWSCASATAFSSRSGTAITLTMCRLPPPKRWASSGAADSTKPPAPCAT